jgi:ketosteroid isomerase-like protein
MMRWSRYVAASAVLFAAVCVPHHAQAQAANEEAAVKAAAQGFAQALAKGDSTAALGFLHDEVLILEGVRAENKAQYRSGHLSADIRYLASVKSENTREGVTISGDTALYTRDSHITGTSARGTAIDRTSAESMVLVRTAQGWKIRHIHWP